jgi:hypothetical protein
MLPWIELYIKKRKKKRKGKGKENHIALTKK